MMQYLRNVGQKSELAYFIATYGGAITLVHEGIMISGILPAPLIKFSVPVYRCSFHLVSSHPHMM